MSQLVDIADLFQMHLLRITLTNFWFLGLKKNDTDDRGGGGGGGGGY